MTSQSYVDVLGSGIELMIPCCIEMLVNGLEASLFAMLISMHCSIDTIVHERSGRKGQMLDI